MTVVAKVQVHQRVRRPVGPDVTTFFAVSVTEGDGVVHVVGHWRGKTTVVAYSWPWSSLVSVHWLHSGSRL